jgi:hypothetical protein
MLRKERTTITPSSCRPRSVGRDVTRRQGARLARRARARSLGHRSILVADPRGRKKGLAHVRFILTKFVQEEEGRVRPISATELPWAEEGRGRLVRSGREPRGAGGGRKGTTKWQDLFHEHIIAAMMVKGREKWELIPGRHPTSTVSSRLHVVTSFAEPRYRRVIATGVPMV